MNYRMILYMVGHILRVEGMALLLPLMVALGYGESSATALGITAVAVLAVGLAITLPGRPKNTVIFASEGFVITALAWLLMSAVGAVPFVLSGEVPSYVDAFFETVSGFTTTGSSVLTDVEAMSHGLLLWRSFTHWLGGMGVLVLVMAILPSGSGRSIHILRAEMPGPVVGKLVPRIRHTALILYVIYIVMTVIEIVVLVLAGMPLFDSVLHAFGSAGTGGFGIKADSLAGYAPHLQWLVAGFTMLFGINFNLYYLLLIRRFRAVAKSGELWCYLGIIASFTAMIAMNIRSIYETFGDSLRHAFFQVISIVTTTGYASTNFDLWPGFSRALLVLLMFIGGCAGSTAGGLKVSRVLLFFKMIRRSLRSLVHPRSVGAVRMEDKPVDDTTLQTTSAYLALYVVLLALIAVLLCLEPFSFETNFTAAVACFNNVGPGLADVGPFGSFAAYSDPAKLLLSLAMLLGRLELFPILLALSPATYIQTRRRNKRAA